MHSLVGYWVKRLLTYVRLRDMRHRIADDFRHAAQKQIIDSAATSDGSRSNVVGEDSGQQRRRDRLRMVSE
jgi:hypothetical protein